LTLLRGLLLVVGAVMILAGFATLTVGGVAVAGPGLWLIVTGGVLMLVAVLERTRYR